MAFDPISSWQREGEKEIDFIFLSSKNTAAKKLKDICSLEEKK